MRGWGVLLLATWLVAAAAADDAPEKKDEPKPEPKVIEHVVVSASATSRTVLDSPAAVDVVSGEELDQAPNDQLVDQLRRIPGINVVQFSARDVNIASRSATGGINTSTLAVADGRNLYQDFLNFVLWEFAPTDFSLIERVEVVRGPASSIWGANAVGGIVQVVTKSPRDTLGGRLMIEAGSYASRRVDGRYGFLAGDWALRVSGGYLESDPFERPRSITNFFGRTVDPDLGLIEGGRDSGTRQPRFDVRADRGDPGSGEWSLQGGWGRTRGWIATGLGPFDVDPGTGNAYLTARFVRGPYEAQVDANLFDGSAVNLVNALPFAFTSASSHAGFRGRHIVGRDAVLGWGADLKRSSYDLTIAPDATDRTEAGAFGEIDLGLSRRLRVNAGARVDHFRETIGTVFSPRAALRFKPVADHTLRIAWGRAFRAPSAIETDLDVPAVPVAILDWQEVDELADLGFPFFVPLAEVVCMSRPDNCGAPPGEIPDYIATIAARGSRDLQEERTASFELGWAGRFGPVELAATLYRTISKGGIDFPQMSSYGVGPDGEPGTADDIPFPADPDRDGIEEAPAVDVCVYLDALPPFRDLCPQGPVTYNEALAILLDGLVPASYGYQNRGEVENRGFEIGGGWHLPDGWLVSANYSWQDVPVSEGRPMDERIALVLAETEAGADIDGDGRVADTGAFVNIPARHRLSLAVRWSRPRWSASASWDRIARTFWQDVATSEYWGYVDAYSLVGMRAARRWPAKGFELALQVTNLLDDPIQQHIYGDVIRRRVGLSLSWDWGGPASPTGGP